MSCLGDFGWPKVGEFEVANGGLTCRCIAERVVQDPSADQQHWTKIENAVLGYVSDNNQKRRMWHALAYYNFVQQIVGLGPGIPPSKDMWGSAKPVFINVLNELQPDVVIVLGKQLWSQLPEEDKQESSISANGKTAELCTYRLIRGKETCACVVPHPARGLGGTWHSVLAKVIQHLEDPSRN